MTATHLTKEQKHVIKVVTFGTMLEWFDIYSYAYMSTLLVEIFYCSSSPMTNLINIFLIFGSALLIRPFGAILWGYFGDTFGRRKAFIWSIIVIIFPTFAMGCLPTCSQVGTYAPWLLVALRLIQAIPTAGEVPGAMCYLYEFSNQLAKQKNRRFMTSWSGVGNQIGAIVALLEVVIMHGLTSHEFMITWGWRISFCSAGVVGLLGIYLRKSLHETPIFKSMHNHSDLKKETTVQVIREYKKQILLATGFGAVSASTFYLLATYIPAYLGPALGLSFSQNVIIMLLFLTLSTCLLPFIGKLGDKINNMNLLIASIALIIVLLYPLYFFVKNHNMIGILIVGIIYIIPTTCITALLGYVFADLFPARVRYTGIGLSFNITDGIIGGFTPAISLYLLQRTGNQADFCWYILGTAIVSLIAVIWIGRRRLSVR